MQSVGPASYNHSSLFSALTYDVLLVFTSNYGDILYSFRIVLQ